VNFFSKFQDRKESLRFSAFDQWESGGHTIRKKNQKSFLRSLISKEIYHFFADMVAETWIFIESWNLENQII